MAQKVTIELVDDVDGSAADETVQFGLDGSTYEVDLSATNADSLRKGLDDYVKVARKITGGDKAPKVREKQVPLLGSTVAASNQEMRDWARSHGVDCPERGRVPRAVREAFEAAGV